MKEISLPVEQIPDGKYVIHCFYKADVGQCAKTLFILQRGEVIFLGTVPDSNIANLSHRSEVLTVTTSGNFRSARADIACSDERVDIFNDRNFTLEKPAETAATVV